MESGYIALASVLVISAVVLIVGTTVALLSINDIQSSLSSQKAEEVLGLVEGCAEDALLRLNNSNTIPSVLTIPQGSCSVVINSQVGANWTFTVSGTIGGYTKSAMVSAARGSTVSVTSWLEQ